jgi:D-alanyl-D-alanine carboxypeptidase/D-alanyl-D-alanine-endopeptidase (penicillin-binding protein 4)
LVDAREFISSRYALSCKITEMIDRTKLSLLFVITALAFTGFSSFTGVSSAQNAPKQTPTAAVTASPGKPIQTLEALQSFIAGRLSRPEVRRGRVGVKIVSLNTGKTVYEQDGDKYFMPASNMKNFTVATAMEKLGPDYKFVTRVFAPSMPDSNGTVKGDLRILGGGDVSISTAFFGTSPTDPETYYKGIDRLVDAIAASGVKKVDGNIVGDESHFKGFAIPNTWEWDDLQWYYGAEVSALPINDNAVDLTVRPGTVGSPCSVSISPIEAMRLYQITNTCTTTAASVKKSLGVNKKIDRNILEITGTIPAGDKGFSDPITITHPADLFVAILKQRLEKRGIKVTGSTRTLPANIVSNTSPVEIAKLESVPFREVAAKTMKPSQNLYTETILWTLGEQERARLDVPTVGVPGWTIVSPQPRDSYELGLGQVKNFITSIGLPADSIVQYDGCGMSRHDVVTPNAVVAVYTYMAKQSPNAQAWRDSLTIGGVDGTLANRFKGTAAAGNIRGKTGTIDQVSALSGYMATVGGEPVVLSIIVNGVPEGRQRTSLIDDIVVAVANFDGKID